MRFCLISPDTFRDNHFRPFDIYCQLADSLGLERHHRYCQLWRLLKAELLVLHDNKHITPVWILDEADLLPLNFLMELPSFLNFTFDTRDIVIIILSGTPKLKSIMGRSAYSALASRILFHFHWQALDDFTSFSKFITSAFQNAGKQEVIISRSGLQIIHMASKGRLRYAHKLITHCLQAATAQNINHISDDIIKSVIDELTTLAVC